MHTVDLTGKTQEEIISIITNAGRTAEKWNEAKKNLGLRKSVADTRKEFQKKPRFEKVNRFDKPRKFKNKFQGQKDNRNQSERKFKPKNKSNKTYAEQTEGIEKSDLDRRKAAGECQRCAWPGDRKGAHKTMDCFKWAKKDVGTAPFLKAKEYQKLKVGAYNQKDSDSDIDLYTTDEEKSGEEEVTEEESDEEDVLEVELQEEFSDYEAEVEESVSPGKHWWDDYSSDSE
jgi:hypothetical protein